MRFHYDKNVDGLYIRFDESPYAESDEVREGVILDFDRHGKIIGLEMLDASKKLSRRFQAMFERKNLPVTLEVSRV